MSPRIEDRFLSYFTFHFTATVKYSCSTLWLSHACIIASSREKAGELIAATLFCLSTTLHLSDQMKRIFLVPRTGILRFTCVAFYRQPTPRNSSSVSVSEISLSSEWLICILAFALLFRSWTFCFAKPCFSRKPPPESHRRCNYRTPIDRPLSA